MKDEPVDVLIVGAGAAGAALAWSLAETRMNILCLEQGDWMKPDDYPGMREDWETAQFGDFAFSPNTRKRPEDYPVNDGESAIATSMFNAVGGSTIHFVRAVNLATGVAELDLQVPAGVAIGDGALTADGQSFLVATSLGVARFNTATRSFDGFGRLLT